MSSTVATDSTAGQPRTASTRPGPVERQPMGPLEAAFIQIGKRFEGDGTSTLSTSLRGNIDPDALRGALLVTQKRHPRLRARIVEEPGGKASYEILAEMAPLELRIKEFDVDPLPWAEESLAAVAEEFNLSSGPLCRVILLRNRQQVLNELIFVVHHTLADGGSGARLTHDVLSFYEQLVQGESLQSLLDATPSLPFVGAEVPPITAKWRDRWAISRRLMRGYIRKRRRGWTPLPKDSAEYKPHWSRHTLSVEESSALLRIARKKRLLPYGAIFAAAVTSLAKSLDGTQFRFICRSPVNARDLPGCKRIISSEHLGCFVSGLDNRYTVTKTSDFWSLAKDACNDMREFVGKQGPAIALSKLPLAGKLATLLRISPKRPPMRDTMSVNFVPCPLKETYGGLTVEAVSGLSRTRYMGVSLMISTTVLHGRVIITLGAVEVSERVRQKFLTTFLETLQQVGRGDI